MDRASRTPGRVVSRNVVSMLSARGFVAVAGLVSLPYVFARLGAHEFGIWAVLSGMAAIVSLADLGLGSAVIRQVAAADAAGGPSPAVLRTTRIALGIALVWGIALSIIGALVITVAWPGLAAVLHFGAESSAARRAVLVLMLGLLVDGVALPWRGVLEGTQRYDVLSRITTGVAVLGAALAMLAVRAGGGLLALAVTGGTATVVRAALVVTVARRRAPSFSPTLVGVGRDDVRALAGYGLRVQVTSASGAVNLELDRFVLTASAGPSVTGGFELGSKVVNLCRLVPVYVLVALFPMAVSRTAEHGPAWLDRFDLVVTKYMTAMATIGAAVLVVCAKPLITLWLGEPNRWATASIVILAPAYALNLTSGATGILARVEGRPGRETTYAVLTVVINLALTWPLLHLLGPIGVPLATAVGIVIGTAHFLVSYHRSTDRPVAPLLRVIRPSVIAAAAAVGAGLAAGSLLDDGPGRARAAIAVAGRGGVAVLVAGAVLAAGRFVTRDEAAALHRMWSRGPAHVAAPVAGPGVGAAVGSAA